ncbi:NAD(P)H-dependent oxidoreductase [Streptomyces sp. NPDC005865]|uniref:NADPH-dependent FMN reductase n=1 Tax=Streptomyces sp. NPDC005865 TaxID=3155453 RepID=UPI0033EDE160
MTTKIGIVLGSTRPGRRGRMVADWVAKTGVEHLPEVHFDILDLADFGLPLLDEPQPPAAGQYSKHHTLRWSEAVGGYDGFVFVTPEYNRSITGALKNAIDFLYAEWNHTAAGCVGYGVQGATRAVEHLRLILSELKVATVRSQVSLSLFGDFTIEDPTLPGAFTPQAHHERTLVTVLRETVEWAEALQELRAGARA